LDRLHWHKSEVLVSINFYSSPSDRYLVDPVVVCCNHKWC